MAYLEKFKVKGKTYYKLVQSVREGEKITHRAKYIGKVLPPKERMQQLEKEFLKAIISPRYRYFSAEEVNKIEEKKKSNIDETKNLSPLERKNMLEEFIIRFTYDSNKLSGLEVTLRQTSLILREGIIPKGFKSLRTVKELENHEKGVIAITKYKGRLTPAFIKKLHRMLMAGVDDSIAGRFRSELQRNVRLAGTPYVPPKWDEIDREIKSFFKWYDSTKNKFHPLELAALVHLKIISIQPFADGNSRLSRLLMNWVLWKKNYPMVDIPIEDLEKYYGVLDEYQIEKNERPFIHYIKETFLKG